MEWNGQEWRKRERCHADGRTLVEVRAGGGMVTVTVPHVCIQCSLTWSVMQPAEYSHVGRRGWFYVDLSVAGRDGTGRDGMRWDGM
jgi:hypothetical protein